MQAMTPCEPEMREKAYRLCRDFLCGAWRKVSSDEIVVKRLRHGDIEVQPFSTLMCTKSEIAETDCLPSRYELTIDSTRLVKCTTQTGGLSNLLYFCALPNSVLPLNNEPHQVLLRIYGQVHDDAVEAVITQSVIFTLLSERCLGPKLYGVFPGGRIEEYIPARPLLTKELMDPAISAIIAEKLARIHRLQVPINKEPTWLSDTMTRWLQHIRTNVNVGTVSQEDRPKVRKLLSYSLEKEYEWIMKMIPKINSPVIFSHNDLQEGNILVNEKATSKEDRLIFIDYEYCSYNYRGFDLANHFCEPVYDYTNPDPPNFYVNFKDVPTKDQQLHFIRAYLRSFQHDNHINLNGNHVTAKQEETVLKEVFFFTSVSHFFWGIWSIVNGGNAEISFGYWDYALSRLEAYYEQKTRILAESGKRKASTSPD